VSLAQCSPPFLIIQCQREHNNIYIYIYIVTTTWMRPRAKPIFFCFYFYFEELRARRQQQQKFDHTTDDEHKHAVQTTGYYDTTRRLKTTGMACTITRRTTTRPTQHYHAYKLRDNIPIPTSWPRRTNTRTSRHAELTPEGVRPLCQSQHTTLNHTHKVGINSDQGVIHC
jgi:hypothetical protein